MSYYWYSVDCENLRYKYEIYKKIIIDHDINEYILWMYENKLIKTVKYCHKKFPASYNLSMIAELCNHVPDFLEYTINFSKYNENSEKYIQDPTIIKLSLDKDT